MSMYQHTDIYLVNMLFNGKLFLWDLLKIFSYLTSIFLFLFPLMCMD